MNPTALKIIFSALIPLLTAFGVSALTGPIFIPWLHRLKFGQEVREEGPSWHKKKSGTPTMGGMMFIAGTAAACIVCTAGGFGNINLLMMSLISLGFALIGFTDDYIKVVKKRNLGLTAPQKFILQCILTVIYVVVLNMTNALTTEIIIPFTDIVWNMPWWLYIPFILIVVTGTVNAVNLTDGLDGLASSITVVVAVFFAFAGYIFENSSAMIFASAIAGGCLGFLIFNHYPAKVFMGDTGSLFLGGAISVLAVGMKMPLVLVIAGFVYMFEALSVIIQVVSFKLTGKRVFKMSPVHHHFEMCGWKETKIVAVFTSVTIILCVISALSIL